MAGFDYARMQGTATRLLDRFAQGVVTITHVVPAEPDPDAPWADPGEPTETTETLRATVRRVEQRYIDGSLIVGTEDQITFAVPSGFVPGMMDRFSIDGRATTLVDIRPLPSAGTPVAYIAFVKS